MSYYRRRVVCGEWAGAVCMCARQKARNPQGQIELLHIMGLYQIQGGH